MSERGNRKPLHLCTKRHRRRVRRIILGKKCGNSQNSTKDMNDLLNKTAPASQPKDNFNIPSDWEECSDDRSDDFSFDPETSDSSSEENESDCVEDMKDFLIQWRHSHGISNSALNAFLKKLKGHDCFRTLPLDSRTILKTPVSSVIKAVAPGEYVHFGIAPSVIRILSTVTNLPSECFLQFNIDGLPLFNSSVKQFWPILGSLPLVSDEVFVIGVYCGETKPYRVADYLQEFFGSVAFIHLFLMLLQSHLLLLLKVTMPTAHVQSARWSVSI